MLENQSRQLLAVDADAGHGCSCCSPSEAAAVASAPVSSTVTATYDVEGMTCEHCVRSVTEELSDIPAVTGVEVSLRAGGLSGVTVHSATPVDEAAVAAAVEEAGYRLVRA